MTQSKELIELAAKLSAFGIDAVDLDMIRRGDMLGPKLGAKVFAALEVNAGIVAYLTNELPAEHQRGFELGTEFAEAEITSLRAKLERATEVKPLDPDMPASELRLHMGEMTAQEIRTARAAIRWANSRLALAEPEGPDA